MSLFFMILKFFVHSSFFPSMINSVVGVITSSADSLLEVIEQKVKKKRLEADGDLIYEEAVIHMIDITNNQSIYLL